MVTSTNEPMNRRGTKRHVPSTVGVLASEHGRGGKGGGDGNDTQGVYQSEKMDFVVQYPTARYSQACRPDCQVQGTTN